jgi:hypothetical protein
MIGFFYLRFVISNPCKDAFVTGRASLEVLGTADRNLVLYSFSWVVIAKRKKCGGDIRPLHVGSGCLVGIVRRDTLATNSVRKRSACVQQEPSSPAVDPLRIQTYVQESHDHD